MVYLFFALLLFFGILILTAAGENEKGRAKPRFFFLVNLAASAAGGILAAVTLLSARYSIFRDGFDAEFSGWAWDMLTVYCRLSYLPAAVFLGIGILSFVFAAADPKQRTGFSMKVRLASMVTFSGVLLLLPPMYAFLTVNDQLPLDVYILLTGIAQALLMRAPFLIEYVRRLREKRKTDAASVTGK